MDNYPVMPFKTAKAFESWLKKNHTKVDGLWLQIARIRSEIKSVTYSEALDIALCYGWIDGLRRGLDEEVFLQKFTPRRKNSKWSLINKEKTARLISQGKMRDAGLAAIEDAKANGRWENAY